MWNIKTRKPHISKIEQILVKESQNHITQFNCGEDYSDLKVDLELFKIDSKISDCALKAVFDYIRAPYYILDMNLDKCRDWKNKMEKYSWFHDFDESTASSLNSITALEMHLSLLARKYVGEDSENLIELYLKIKPYIVNYRKTKCKDKEKVVLSIKDTLKKIAEFFAKRSRKEWMLVI